MSDQTLRDTLQILKDRIEELRNLPSADRGEAKLEQEINDSVQKALAQIVNPPPPGPTIADLEALIEATLNTLRDKGEDEAIAELRCKLQGEPLEEFDAWDTPPTPFEWLVDDWIPKGRITLLTGEGGIGKSKLTLMLAYALATDLPTWMPGKKAPRISQHRGGAQTTFIAGWEDSSNDILLRLNKAPNPTDIVAKHQTTQLRYIPMAKRGPVWSVGEGSHTSTLATLTPAGAKLRRRCEETNASLLVVDPLAAAFAANENDRALVRAFLANWNAWAMDTGCSVVFVAHPPKSEGRYSGSTDWRNAARSMISMSNATVGKKPRSGEADTRPTYVRLEVEKCNYGPPPEAIKLTNWEWWTASECPNAESNKIEESKDGKSRAL